MSDEVIVTINDATELRYCRRGIREFTQRHGIDYVDFLRNGIPASRLTMFDDAMVSALIEAARNRSKSNG